MEPVNQPLAPHLIRNEPPADDALKFDSSGPDPNRNSGRDLRWVFVGDQGLRAGWSTLIFLLLVQLFVPFLATASVSTGLIHPREGFSPRNAVFGELVGVLTMLAAAAIVAAIEGRRILDYNLRGPRRSLRFAGGLVAGFAALSALAGALAAGGWLRFGGIALDGRQGLFYAVLWGGAFLLVGFKEEGTMRCFLLFTLTRGINFWWAAGLEGLMCADQALRAHGRGAQGVYALAILGVIPSLVLHVRQIPNAGFWHAAWVTSTYFAYGHTANRGENWIGIFAAGAVGFVFCVSVKVTRSAWWAIGCHTAWDWAETYFYGTPDSGLVAGGHFLTTSPAGNALWSGGAAGPEGSVLALGIIVLLLIMVLLLYGQRDRTAALPVRRSEQATE